MPEDAIHLALDALDGGPCFVVLHERLPVVMERNGVVVAVDSPVQFDAEASRPIGTGWEFTFKERDAKANLVTRRVIVRTADIAYVRLTSKE